MMTNEALKVLEQRAFQLREEINDRQGGDRRRASAVAKAKEELERVEADYREYVSGTHDLIRQRTEVDKAINTLKVRAAADEDPDSLD